jgi:hypothetical protein
MRLAAHRSFMTYTLACHNSWTQRRLKKNTLEINTKSSSLNDTKTGSQGESDQLRRGPVSYPHV